MALQNGPGQCADVTDGGESAQLQSWRCFADNTNQVGDMVIRLIFLIKDVPQIFFGQPPVPPQPSPSEGVTLSPYVNGSLCLMVLGGFQELQTGHVLYVTYPPARSRLLIFPLIPHSRPCNNDQTPEEKRFFFEIGQVGIRQRPDDSGVEYTLEAYPLDVGGETLIGPEDDSSGDPYSRFVPEAGEGDFTGSVRLRNTYVDLCLQSPFPFLFDEGIDDSPYLEVCNDSEPLQVSCIRVVWLDKVLRLLRFLKYFTFRASPV